MYGVSYERDSEDNTIFFRGISEQILGKFENPFNGAVDRLGHEIEKWNSTKQKLRKGGSTEQILQVIEDIGSPMSVSVMNLGFYDINSFQYHMHAMIDLEEHIKWLASRKYHLSKPAVTFNQRGSIRLPNNEKELSYDSKVIYSFTWYMPDKTVDCKDSYPHIRSFKEIKRTRRRGFFECSMEDLHDSLVEKTGSEFIAINKKGMAKSSNLRFFEDSEYDIVLPIGYIDLCRNASERDLTSQEKLGIRGVEKMIRSSWIH